MEKFDYKNNKTRVRLSKEQKKELYVPPEIFWDEIKLYYERRNIGNNAFPTELSRMVDKLANRYIWDAKFKDYHFRDEMIGDAKLKMIETLLEKKFTLYSYTYLKTSFFYFENGKTFIRNYKRGSDDRKEGGENMRGKLVFLAGYREIDTSEEILVKRKGNVIIINGEEEHELTEKELDKIEVNNEGTYLRTKNKAFGYFTQTCKNCYVARIKLEEKQLDIKRMLQEKEYSELSSKDGWTSVRMPKGNNFEEDFYDLAY